MKLPIPFLASLAFAATAFSGENVVTTTRYHVSETGRTHCSAFDCGLKSAGVPGAFYRSNFSRNAVVFINDTADFVTFFVYSGDICGPNEVNEMIRAGAQVYEVVVPPYQTSFTDRRGRYFWVGSKRGQWGIDPARHQLARM